MIAKVNPGDRLRISAADWNAIADSVNASDLGTGQSRRSRGLFIYNNSDGDLQAGLCLKAGTAGNAASDDYAEMPVVPHAVPTNGETGCMYIVTAEDIPAGDMGRVVMAGPCYALFSQYDAAMPCAVPDGSGRLKSSWTGDIRVVYADSVKKQGVVLIGAAAAEDAGFGDGGGLFGMAFNPLTQALDVSAGFMSRNGEFLSVAAASLPLPAESGYVCATSTLVNKVWTTPAVAFATPSAFAYPVGWVDVSWGEDDVLASLRIRQFNVPVAVIIAAGTCSEEA